MIVTFLAQLDPEAIGQPDRIFTPQELGQLRDAFTAFIRVYLDPLTYTRADMYVDGVHYEHEYKDY